MTMKAYTLRISQGAKTGTATCYAEDEQEAAQKVIDHLGDAVIVESVTEEAPNIKWIK